MIRGSGTTTIISHCYYQWYETHASKTHKADEHVTLRSKMVRFQMSCVNFCVTWLKCAKWFIFKTIRNNKFFVLRFFIQYFLQLFFFLSFLICHYSRKKEVVSEEKYAKQNKTANNWWFDCHKMDILIRRDKCMRLRACVHVFGIQFC